MVSYSCVLQCDAVRGSALRCVAVCCSALHCGAVRQCVAVRRLGGKLL